MRKNNKKLKSAKLILVMILIYSLCTITYVLWVRGNINKEISNYLAEVSKQSAKTIKTQVQGDFETIEAMANFIGSQEVFDLESSLDLLRKEVKAHAFKRMGIILPNGEATMTDGSVCDFSDREYFKAAMNGKTTISGRLIDKIDGKYINVYGTPVYDGNNRVIAVLFATHDTRILKRLLEIPTFDDEG